MCAQTAAPSLFLLNLLPAVYVVGVGVGHTHHACLLLAPWEDMRMIIRFTPCSIAAALRTPLGASCAPQPQMVALGKEKELGHRRIN